MLHNAQSIPGTAPSSGIRMELDRIREIGAGLHKAGAALNERIQPILAPSPPESNSTKDGAIAQVPACDLQGELADLRRTLESALAGFASMHDRVRL